MCRLAFSWRFATIDTWRIAIYRRTFLNTAPTDAAQTRDSDKYIVRFHDPGLRAQLKSRAALNERTLNAEIIYLVKKGLATESAVQGTAH